MSDEAQQLIDALTQRDAIYTALTDQIVSSMEDTLFTAISQFFGVPLQAVEYIDVDMAEDTLVATALVTYGETDTIPPLVQYLSPAHDPSARERIVRVRVAIEDVYQSPAVLCNTLTTFAEALRDELEQPAATSVRLH